MTFGRLICYLGLCMLAMFFAGVLAGIVFGPHPVAEYCWMQDYNAHWIAVGCP